MMKVVESAGVHGTNGELRMAWAAVALSIATGLCFAAIAGGQPPVQPSQLAAPQTSGPSLMDEPLHLIALAGQTYSGIHDYTCLFVKRERIRGQLQAENVIDMKVRTQPFSVYLRWLGPAPTTGQEACYVTGRNNGMMRVHTTGIAGVVGFVSIDPRDPRATQSSRHAITEAGIGNLIDRYAQRWAWERQVNRTQVQIADYNYAQRPCTRVELTHPDRNGGYYSYRSVVYFDKEWHLPVRVENYDWPRQGGSPEGELVECYSYANLRFNTGLNDLAFNH
jgi:hypothetical protein